MLPQGQSCLLGSCVYKYSVQWVIPTLGSILDSQLSLQDGAMKWYYYLSKPADWSPDHLTTSIFYQLLSMLCSVPTLIFSSINQVCVVSPRPPCPPIFLCCQVSLFQLLPPSTKQSMCSVLPSQCSFFVWFPPPPNVVLCHFGSVCSHPHCSYHCKVCAVSPPPIIYFFDTPIIPPL